MTENVYLRTSEAAMEAAQFSWSKVQENSMHLKLTCIALHQCMKFAMLQILYVNGIDLDEKHTFWGLAKSIPMHNNTTECIKRYAPIYAGWVYMNVVSEKLNVNITEVLEAFENADKLLTYVRSIVPTE